MANEIAKKPGCSLSGPGPADYFLPSTVGHCNHDISKSRAPGFTMGVRLPGLFCDQRVKSESPGPKYQVEYLTKYGKSEVPLYTAPGPTRPKSSKLLGEMGSCSLERSQSPRKNPGLDLPRKRSDSSLKKISDVKSYDSRKNAKLIESRNLSLNNELRAFYMENQSKPMAKRQRISSARPSDGSRKF